jgi:putative hydrolase of the HAD superfamily
VVNLGGFAIHVPYHVTWQHEELLSHEMPENHFVSVEKIMDVLGVIGNNSSKNE